MKKTRIYFFLFTVMMFTANISFGQYQFSTGNMGKFIRVGSNFQYLPFINLHYTINCDSIKLPNSKTITANSVFLNTDTTKVYMKSQSNYLEHYIGELYGGGIIIAVWKTSGVEHGLIITLKDQSNHIAWSSNTEDATNGTSIWDGATNTTTNTTGTHPDLSKANYMCDTLTIGGYTDWYLPSTLELDLAYSNGALIGHILGANSLAADCYWSSTERDNLKAYGKYMISGKNEQLSKSLTFKVRAMRKF